MVSNQVQVDAMLKKGFTTGKHQRKTTHGIYRFFYNGILVAFKA